MILVALFRSFARRCDFNHFFIHSLMTAIKSIICVAQTPWKGEFQRPAVQLLTELSPRYRVLYVDYQYTYKDVLMHYLGKIQVPIQKIAAKEGTLEKITFPNQGEAYIWTPPVMLPINWMPASLHDFFLKINVKKMLRGLLPLMRQLNIEAPIVLNAFHPVYGLALIGKLDEQANIYYCFDEITAEPWMTKHGSRYEEPYLKKVDAVVSTSDTLRIAKGKIQPHSYAVKNGVNFELFHQGYTLRSKTDRTKKTVGYLGTADNRVNADIVAHCVKNLPSVTFQFIGPVNHPELVKKLEPYPNVEFVGSKEPEELPAYLAKMHAGIIPFVRNEHTYTIYPLKINEYLAAGLPVVSTEFSMLGDFKDVISLANTPETFLKSLQTALNETDSATEMQRIAVARTNSWIRRAEEFEDVMNLTLHRLAKK
jgi:glycosyltransferase involved in cell wall biosynthesis